MDLRQFTVWCLQHDRHLFDVRRVDIECFARDLEDRGKARATAARSPCSGGSPTPEDQRRYSPATCKVTDIHVLNGEPDPELISTSYVERQNLTMRMGMRRFTRLTNGFSKKVENLTYAVSLHYMHYNSARPHLSLKDERGRKITPAMAAGVTGYAWSPAQIAALLD